MNQIFAGTAALALALVLWGLGRKPRKPLLSSTDASFVAGLNRTQLSFVLSKQEVFEEKKQISATSKTAWEPPKTSQECINLRKQLFQLIDGGPKERLNAVAIAGLWGNKSVLPIIRRGLRDSDSVVVYTAAEAIKQFRSNSSSTTKSNHKTLRPPRNVSLMR